MLSVITEFDGLLVKFRDSCYGEGQGSKPNGVTADSKLRVFSRNERAFSSASVFFQNSF
jgi:hypothetical protein